MLQCGVLSPFIFNPYVNDLLRELEGSGIGCHICNGYFFCIMYADDLLLMPASESNLQRILDICYRFEVNNSIVFNQRKSIIMHHSGKEPA